MVVLLTELGRGILFENSQKDGKKPKENNSTEMWPFAYMIFQKASAQEDFPIPMVIENNISCKSCVGGREKMDLRHLDLLGPPPEHGQ